MLTSIKTFFYQGGYGWFVWGAYSMGVLLLSAEILYLRQQRKTQLTNIRRLLRRQAQELSDESTE